MILRKYGLELHSLTEEDTEKVRKWRNDDFVQERMLFQNEISSQDQKRWFARLDKSTIYLIIRYKQTKIGLINVKNIDWKNRTGEAGVFIGDSEYRNSIVPMLAIHCLMDTFFEEFCFSMLNAKVRCDNMSALQFNQDLGYQIDSKTENAFHLSIDKSTYLEKREKLSGILTKYSGDLQRHTFSQEEKDYLFPLK